MKAILVNQQRCFVAHDRKEMHTVALKLLNEQRTVEPSDSKLYPLLCDVTDEQDGETAIQLVNGLFDIEVFDAEVI